MLVRLLVNQKGRRVYLHFSLILAERLEYSYKRLT